jgi:serine/threonine-protein kinase
VESPPNSLAEGTFGAAAPERLGRYPLLSVIGTGSMGIVYKSFDPQLSRAVALKTIRRELLDDEMENFSARFRIEAQAAGTLTHPGIVHVYEYGEAEGYAYIAMEYVEGHSLRDCFERQVRFNTEQAINIVAQLLKALQYAHERGVWHRDVKPANILLMSDGQAKVTDFGIARVESVNLAQVDSIMGTPGFIAPEMYLGEEFDQRIDLFAAGVVFYQLLTGMPPFVGTPEKIMFKVCYETPLPVSVVARQPALHPFDAVTLKALARRPEDRFSSAAEFLEALLLAKTGGPVSADATVMFSRRKTDIPAGDETIIVPRHDAETVDPSGPDETVMFAHRLASRPRGADETVIVPSRKTDTPAAADETRILPRRQASAGVDETVIISRGSGADTANLPIQPFATDTPVTEPFLPLQAFVLEPTADREPGRPQPQPQPQAAPPNIPPPAPAWNAEHLAQIEKHLARFVGPIARVLVRGAARETGDPVSLIQRLAAKIGNLPDREAFLRVTGGAAAAAIKMGRSNSDTEYYGGRAEGGSPLTPEYIARASQLLAVQLGPIARILARRAAQPGASQEQFVAALATHLNDDGERARFLKALA